MGMTRAEIVALLQTGGRQRRQLWQAADEARRSQMGDGVHLRALLEFSSYCRRRCHYCGLRVDNARQPRFRMETEEIVAVACSAQALGYKTVVLQSGEDPYYDIDTLADIVGRIKSGSDVAVTLSCGEFTLNGYQRLWEAGTDRYLLRHETANPRLYDELHPDSHFSARIGALRELREVGFQVGAGFMVGLPGQTIEDLADDILLLRALDVEMAGIGPFIPHPETPLASASRANDPAGSQLKLTISAIAVARLAVPLVHLPATTALGALDPLGRQMALQAGANVLMPNITPAKYRPKYQLYPGKICTDEEPAQCRACVEGIIGGLGRSIAPGYGHSPKLKDSGGRESNV